MVHCQNLFEKRTFRRDMAISTSCSPIFKKNCEINKCTLLENEIIQKCICVFETKWDMYDVRNSNGFDPEKNIWNTGAQDEVI